MSLGFLLSLTFLHLSIFSFSYLFAALILLHYWAHFQFKKFRESIIKAGKFYHGVATCTCSCRQFCSEFSVKFPSIFVHILGSTEPITLIWVSVERSFPPAELEYWWCQLRSKVMMSEEKQRPTLITASYGCQWVKFWILNLSKNLMFSGILNMVYNIHLND